MGEDSIQFDIPVPWAKKPITICAKGIRAVIVAAIVAVGIVAIIHFS